MAADLTRQRDIESIAHRDLAPLENLDPFGEDFDPRLDRRPAYIGDLGGDLDPLADVHRPQKDHRVDRCGRNLPLAGVPQGGNSTALVRKLQYDAAVQRVKRVGLTGLGDDRQAHARVRRRLWGWVLNCEHAKPPFLAPSLSCQTGPMLPGFQRGRVVGLPIVERRPPLVLENVGAMLEDQFIELIDPLVRGGGSVLEVGEEFREPPLSVLRYYRRRVPLNWVPIFGEAHSVVAVVRQPVDIDSSQAAQSRLLTRLAMAVNGRFPPWRGLVIGLTTLVLTPEPIEPADDGMLREVLGVKLGRMRVVPFGLIRVNLGQEAIALAVNSGPDELFTEPTVLADALCEKFRRYVPLMEG